MTSSERIEALVAMTPALAPWVGGYDGAMLREWLRLELGSAEALDEWSAHGTIVSKAVPLSPLLHVLSGNTPHAAFQSIFRGLLLGAINRVKLPSAGLPEVEGWLARLPPELGRLVKVRKDLPEEWRDAAAVVVFGGEGALEGIRGFVRPGTPLIEHGPKLSIAVVLGPDVEKAAASLAGDVLRFEQRGCQSVRAVYVDGPEDEVLRFGDALAAELEAWRSRHPRETPGLSGSGAISNAREVARFRAANGERIRLWESRGSTAWTIVFDENPALLAGPLHGFVRLHRLPQPLTPAALGSEARFLSTVVLHPFAAASSDVLELLAPDRICAPGRAQEPTLFWHHDGYLPLGSLVRWRDIG